MIGNYMPSGPDVEIDYSKFTYGPKQTLADESDSKPSEYASCESDSSVETSTSMPGPVENASKVVCKPKAWTDAPIIEEYESDSDNDSLSNVQEDKEKPSFAFTDSVKHSSQQRSHHQIFHQTFPTGLRWIQRISLTRFPAQSVGSSNTDVLELPCLLVLITGTSQSRQHDKSESDSYYLSD
nr:hypothetical protein [Tanacetum cinerariifolium]